MTAIDDAVARLACEPLGLQCKPFPATVAGTPLGEVGRLDWRVGDGRLLLPAMLLSRPRLAHNIAVMAEYCAERGLSLAPHGKTTMAPQIFAAQLAAGAWGMTAATAGQAQVMRAFDVERIVIANELVDAGALEWAARELHGDAELLCLVDSVAGARRMDALLGAAGPRRPLDVLLELGMRGKRAGQRSAAGAREVAAAVGEARHLRLAGVECFEGVAGSNRQPDTVTAVDALIADVANLASELAPAFEADEVILSAGGSVFFDRLQPLVEADLSRPVRVVARSGCYVTHDDGAYDRASPLSTRLLPALEVWGEVLSCPEPGLAIVNVGKRDAPFDSGLPTPQHVLTSGGERPQPLTGCETTALNDQHAFVRGDGLEVGDLVGFGISHPCTAFDKWRVIPVVDDELRIVDAMRTYF